MPARLMLLLALGVVALAACVGAVPLASPSSDAGRPTVVIVSPPSGTVAIVGQTLEFQVNGSDSVGVSRLDLQVNGVLVDSATVPGTTGQPAFNALLRWTPSAAESVVVGALAYRADGTASNPAIAAVSIVDSTGATPLPFPSTTFYPLPSTGIAKPPPVSTLPPAIGATTAPNTSATHQPTIPPDVNAATPTAAATSAPTAAATSTPTSAPTATAVAATPIPTLNFTLPPVYGSTSLTSGFVPDPHSVSASGGGPVNPSYLGGGCGGFATSAPTYSVLYTAGAFPLLRFYFVGTADATMIINAPSGSYKCNDDSSGTTHPTIDYSNPASGRYDVWIGSKSSSGAVSGTLYVTENSGNHP